MQLAAVEYARSVCGLEGAHTTEIDVDTIHPIIDLLPYQEKLLAEKQLGGTMRLGAYTAQLKPGSLVSRLYNGNQATERHRHRYEMNPLYVDILERNGLSFSGSYEREDGTALMEFLELPHHPFFVATQAHPEFTSRLDSPNPLFAGFVQACQIRMETQRGATMAVQEDTMKEGIMQA
jgi:CTP synthase